MIINSITGVDELFSGGWDRKVISWNLEQLQKLNEVDVADPVTTMTYNHTERSLYVAGESTIQLVKST